MKTREIVIRRWFDMWLQKKDLGISEIFQIMPSTSKVGGRNITALQKSNFGLTNGIPAALFFNGI